MKTAEPDAPYVRTDIGGDIECGGRGGGGANEPTRELLQTLILPSPSFSPFYLFLSRWPTSEVRPCSLRILRSLVLLSLEQGRADPRLALLPPLLALPSLSGLSLSTVPVKLLQESLGHVITVELKTGQTYRGKLADGESSFFAFNP